MDRGAWRATAVDYSQLGFSTGMGSHSLLQGIFLTQGSDLGLTHCGWILYNLSHQGISDMQGS